MSDETPAAHARSESTAQRGTSLSKVNVAGSVVLAAVLLVVFFVWGSELALAQAADSISDVLTGVLLAWAARTATRPPDDEHPLGHARAEPIAALVVAVLASLLATEVGRSAVMALLGHASAVFDWPVAAVFATKVIFKLGVARVAGGLVSRTGSPVLDALRVDARNDALVGSVALVGFGLARGGLPAVDPVLAVGVAIYVALSSMRLAITSVNILLGTSAPLERRNALRALVAETPEVTGVAQLVAISHGASLHVEIDLLVRTSLSLVEAHDVAHAVEARLRAEPDVGHVIVHVTPSTHDAP